MVLDRFRLDDRVAIVTGAGRGIGAATADALAEAGADVVVGARSADQLAEIVAAVEAHGRRAVAVDGDLSTRDGMAALVDT
ncbi:MAG: SDR family NAD(P)-dependent oxidoreductase, partial [Actinomycetota bacterium]